ncbi:tetratricopeptide repeat (TPR)-like superfamily protein [Artemisia annua]|uniref:Tetratricopeptide repeat (TPR)-like superfamily protein n=2 Tax=Artemisia annua TaxID=35608 RepID=A0A2U1M215_ARTAN|nr:tetratricopeptide repeat (TPR)-like superfamily protein [Artemisia annua]
MDEEASREGSILTQLKEAVESNPDDPAAHYNLGLFLWERTAEESKEKAAEHFVIAAKLNPQDANAFRYLGHYYSKVSVDNQRALKCYQRAISLAPQDSESGESMCDLLDKEGKESLEIAICREASGKSPRAFWAFRRLGFLQVHQKKWSEAVQNLQQAIRGYPKSADLWEALGLAYQRLSMFTAAVKSYGRAIELEESRVFALVESGYVFLMLGSHRKGVEQFQQALQISPENVAAHYGLGCGLLELSKECISSGAFGWGATILEEASTVTKTGTGLAKNVSSMWKLHGDIQLTYANCLPWMDDDPVLEKDEKALTASILSWKNARASAALSARHSYQQALRLAPWQANIYTDIAITIDVINSFKGEEKQDIKQAQLPEKLILGGLLLEGFNHEFWVALGCLSHHLELKQHAFIRSLQLDVSLAVAWAYLGKLYRKLGEKKLAQNAFDRARSIDPSLALPWAGMSADMSIRGTKPNEAFDCCLMAVQMLPLPEFQMGLANLALLSGQLSSSEVFGPIRQALHHAPQYPECHNLLGLVCEARCNYLSAITSYKVARGAVIASSGDAQKLLDISVNLARAFCKAGLAYEAVNECEELKTKGFLEWEGLHIYALSLWQLGKNDQALSVVRILAARVKSLEPRLASTTISFICRLLYYISGREAVVASILKMPKDLFKSSEVSFVVSSIHILDQSNQLEAVVSSSRSALLTPDEIIRMHILIALSKLVKKGSANCLDIENGIKHIRKNLHKYPNNYLLRNVLGYLLLSSNEWKDTHLSTRCFTVSNTPSELRKEEGLRRAPEILGASAVACFTSGNLNNKFSFPTCKDHSTHPDQSTHQHGSLKLLQKWCHQEPWNQNARYLLILNYIQKAREERYPQHICTALERLTRVALSDESRHYQKFQLLLCASEISLQSGDHIGCINHAKNASKLSVPDGYLFFAHLLLCRAYAADDNRACLSEEYTRCLNLGTDHHIGLICLKYIESQYGLETNDNTIELKFEECSKDIKYSWNVWTAILKLVQGLIAVWNHDFIGAEELFAQACSLNDSESCLHLCHGAICMELARQQCDSDYLLLAKGSLKKARDTSRAPLPILQLLLAQAEASLGYRQQWERHLMLEWSSWPPEMRPSEIYLQMHLLLKPSEYGGTDTTSITKHQKNPLRWIHQAIHLNPSCSRYWKALHNL